MPSVDDFFDTLDDGWSQPWYPFELAFADQLFDVAVERTDAASCVLVGSHLKRIAAFFEFQQRGNFIQQVGELIFIHSLSFSRLCQAQIKKFGRVQRHF